MLKKARLPFAAPSANPSGEKKSPLRRRRCSDTSTAKLPPSWTEENAASEKESTIIDMSAAPYKILRSGALPEEEIADALAESLKVVGITGGTGCGKKQRLCASLKSCGRS